VDTKGQNQNSGNDLGEQKVDLRNSSYRKPKGLTDLHGYEREKE
jgi:hypothetical protein